MTCWCCAGRPRRRRRHADRGARPAGRRIAAQRRIAAGNKRPGAGDGRVFAGTLLASGGGLALVDATGPATAFGRIGGALAAIESPPTPLQTQIRTLVRLFSLAGTALSALVVLLYGLQRGDWLAGLLAGITLAIAMLPEEFVLIPPCSWRWARRAIAPALLC